MGNEGQNSYRVKPKVVSAFRWDGTVRDVQSVPSWAKLLIRSAALNEATDPPGLIMDTLKSGIMHIPHGGWFLHHVSANIVLMCGSDEVFSGVYELNV